MISVRICSLLFVATLLMVQSGPVTVSHQPSSSGLQNAVSQPDLAAQDKIAETYGKLPLSFEANQGQTDPQVKFLSRGADYTLFLTGDEAVFSFRGNEALHGNEGRNDASVVGRRPRPTLAAPAINAVLRMKLVKANLAAAPTGEDALLGRSNYFVGSDPKQWHSSVPTYKKVKYQGIYPGIDLVYYGNQRQLEYDFVVAPGADPRRIQFDVRGANKITRDEHEDLVLEMGEREVRWHKPAVYQEKDGARQRIEGHYVIQGDKVGFRLESYDASRPVVIDPALAYSTYLGGNGIDYGNGIAVDTEGNAYLTGFTESTNFPVTPGAFQTTFASGGTDAFVAKLNPTGSALVYSTYLGGSNEDIGYAIALDAAGNAYVTGQTYSADFPVTPGAFQTMCHGCVGDPFFNDAFVTKLNPTGSALVYSTFLGGSTYDYAYGIALNAAGNAYVTGATYSANFPTTPGAFQTTCGGCGDVSDAFVTELNAIGSALVYSTFLGGGNYDYGNGIAVNAAGNAYVTGVTYSIDFPTTPGVFQTTCGGGCAGDWSDGFVTQLNPAGSALVYSTYLGGSSLDAGSAIAVDTTGNAYVGGATESADFPITPGAFQTKCGGGCTNWDGFVAKVNPAGSALVYSTYLGGSGRDIGLGIVADSFGNAYVAGWTYSTDFPTTPDAFQTKCGGGCANGSTDAFMTKLNPTGSALVYSTYLGGSESDSGSSIAVDSTGSAYLTGSTGSTDFPVTKEALQTRSAGSNDAFVAKFATVSGPIVKLGRASIAFRTQLINTKSPIHKVDLANIGTGPLNISAITASGDFSQTNDCGRQLKIGTSCLISLAFQPGTGGYRTGALTITDNAASSPQMVVLRGYGTFFELSSTALHFGSQTVGTTSNPMSVTLTNLAANTSESVALHITGGDSGDFGQSSTCGPVLAGQANCTISVTFSPTTQGNRMAVLEVVGGGGGPRTVTLGGTAD